MVPSTGLPSGHFADAKCLQAGLAVFAFRGLRTLKQKHRSAFQSLTEQQAVVVPTRAFLLAKMPIKNAQYRD